MAVLFANALHERPRIYFFLGYNVIVPPYVRQGLFTRHLNHDPVIEKMRKPMLLCYGEQDA